MDLNVVASKDHERLRILLEYWFVLKQDELEGPSHVVFHVPNVPNPQLFQHLKHQLQNPLALRFVFLR